MASLARNVNFSFLLSELTSDTLFHFLPVVIDLNAFKCDAKGETDNKWADLTIPDRYTTVQ